MAAFRNAREADYVALSEETDALSRGLAKGGKRDRDAIATKIERLTPLGEGRQPPRQQASHTLDARSFQGRVWVTRPRPGIDRLSSA